MGGLDQRRDAGDVGTGHGRPGYDVVVGDQVTVTEGSSPLRGRPRGQDLHAGTHYIRFEDRGAGSVGPAGGEVGHLWGRLLAQDRLLELDVDGGGGGEDGEVIVHAPAVPSADGDERESELLGTQHIGRVRGENPGSGPGSVQLVELLLEVAGHAEQHLPGDDRGVQGPVRARLRRRVPGGEVQRGPLDEEALRVDRLPPDCPRVVTEGEDSLVIPVDGGGPYGGDPRGAVDDGVAVGTGVSGGAGDEDPLLQGGEGTHGHHVRVVGRVREAEGEGHDVDAVLDRLIHPGQDVGGGGLEGVAEEDRLVHGHPRHGRHPHRGALRVPEIVRAPRGSPRRRRRGPGSDQLPIAVGGVESRARLAPAAPPRRDGGHAAVVEAVALRPDARVDDPDDDVVAEVGRRPEAAVPVETEEARGVGGVELRVGFRDGGDVARVRFQSPELGRGEDGAETVEDVVVGVEMGGVGYFSFVSRNGEGREEGREPMVASGEGGGHGRFVHVDDVRSAVFLGGGGEGDGHEGDQREEK
ncbi:hypothetical protein H6P81_015347 [Aristolochia fimbriata]|uniref:Uncharacterized protein n=1 Tax=Aristolochia fimbriata TaxID=158543 RepID=A0AAV7E5D4_ARIFI|nr:hypothetical protein H6P81_015347 [Aristolochia fimbriata]